MKHSFRAGSLSLLVLASCSAEFNEGTNRGGGILTGESLSNYWKWKEFEKTNIHVFTMTGVSVNAEELREFKGWMKKTNHWSMDGSTTKPTITLTNETKAVVPMKINAPTGEIYRFDRTGIFHSQLSGTQEVETITNSSKAFAPLTINATDGKVASDIVFGPDTNLLGNSSIYTQFWTETNEIYVKFNNPQSEPLTILVNNEEAYEFQPGWTNAISRYRPIVTGPSNGWWHIEFRKP